MKIGFYLENKDIPDVDFTDPESGNPGCGGTEFLFATLPYYLNKFGEGRCIPLLLANNAAYLPESVESIVADNFLDAARKAKAAGCCIFVYRPKRQSETEILDIITELQLPTVMWVHVTPTMPYLRKIAKNPYVRAFVCVEHEQHDQIYDTPLLQKLTYIVNGFDINGFRHGLKSDPKDKNLVVYIGALVLQKGFHMLAEAWPKVIKRNPAARLFVIGSGAVYNHKAKLGPWGIADSNYEQKHIIPHLSGPDGKPIPSVIFAGRLGPEKKDIMARAMVGVPNPTGFGENCPGSALELEACGTAVVSGAREGMLDTIIHNHTGLLGGDVSTLVENICRLLSETDLNTRFAHNGIRFVRERYDYDNVVNEWCTMFERLVKGLPPQARPTKKNYLTHQKWARVLNRLAQNTIGRVIYWPAVEDAKEQLIKIRKSMHS